MSIGRNFFNHPSLPQPRRRPSCDLMDTSDSSLPSGSSITIDGTAVTNGMRVLFTNLGSGNNEVYKASFELDVPNPPVVWTATADPGSGGPGPLAADLMLVTNGSANANRLLVYDNGWKDADMMIERLLQVGNAQTASSSVGSLSHKVAIYDNSGNLLGYVPVYASIT